MVVVAGAARRSGVDEGKFVGNSVVNSNVRSYFNKREPKKAQHACTLSQ